jgi:hypothetical protein
LQFERAWTCKSSTFPRWREAVLCGNETAAGKTAGERRVFEPATRARPAPKGRAYFCGRVVASTSNSFDRTRGSIVPAAMCPPQVFAGRTPPPVTVIGPVNSAATAQPAAATLCAGHRRLSHGATDREPSIDALGETLNIGRHAQPGVCLLGTVHAAKALGKSYV